MKVKWWTPALIQRLTALLLSTSGLVHVAQAAALEAEFRAPVGAARPHAWWHWMNGHVSREGITQDLEAMQKAGLSGFTLFNVSEGTPPGPVVYMSEAWWELFRHTVAEAARLGLEMGVANCSGWSSSGGPWITPDRAMQEVVWTEHQVEGPAQFDEQLAIPEPALGIERDMARNPEMNKRYYVEREQVRGYYRDIALLAFPAPKGDFRLKDWKEKAGFAKPRLRCEPDERSAPEAAVINPEKILNLSGQMDKQGKLKWMVPPGKWTLLRMGYQPTGRKSHPASVGGEGLEVDKLSFAAVEFHWQHSVDKFLKAAREVGAASALKGVLIDSYEVGHQNWNTDFARNFRELRGYEIGGYLPALTGRIVCSVDTTEKFLWDFRKTLSELIARNYYGQFAKLSRQNGLELSAETYGLYGNTDDFSVAGTPDVPTAEWWALDNRTDFVGTAKLASSAAHTYGKRLVGAEAFTGKPSRAFEESPYALKAQGDYYFCRGINRISFHSFVHDPYSALPGLSLGAYGTRVDRRNTWWPFAHAWFDYLARCQALLQHGQFAADLLYFPGEEAPQVCAPWQPPAGFDYDFCSREILGQLSVKDQFLELPTGMRYRVLVLPETRQMRGETLKKIEALVLAGATVVGPKPVRMPSLEGGQQEEKQVRQIAERLWGNCDGEKITLHKQGKGRVYWGKPVAEILKDLQVAPDFAFELQGNNSFPATPYPGNGVDFIHRKTADADFYFVSNQHYEPKTIEAVFRVHQRQPEIWHPDTGRLEAVSQFSATADGRTSLTLNLDPAGSVFVVFRKALKEEGTVAPSKGRKQLAAAPIELKGPWQLEFPSGWGAPEKVSLPKLICWTKHENLEVRHFSGIATYKTEFDFPAERLKNGRHKLDLGDVQVAAEVTLNGINVGTLWKAPYATEVTEALRPGKNQLEIKVANLWVNRLIGDSQHPEDYEWRPSNGANSNGNGLVKLPEWVLKRSPHPPGERKAFTSWRWPHLAGKELLPSGLLGPVTLVTEAE